MNEMTRIRRPLFFVAPVYAGAIFAGASLGMTYCLASAGAGLLYLIAPGAGLDRRKWMQPWALLLAAAVFTAGISLWTYHIQEAHITLELEALDQTDQTAAFTGLVEKRELRVSASGAPYMCLQVRRQVEGQGLLQICLPPQRVRITCRQDAIYPGERIRALGKLEFPQGKRNPNGFDMRMYLRSCGVQTVMHMASVTPLAGDTPAEALQRTVYRHRERFLQRLADDAGEDTASLMKGILFGDKNDIDADVLETFQKNGTAHVLAVSGLHVGILYATLVKIWDGLMKVMPGAFGRRRGKRFLIVTGVFFSLYSFLAGLAPSVVRAAIMVMLHAFAQASGRRYDLSTAAMAIGLACLLHNPYVLYHPGFQMSYLAVLMIALVHPYVRRIYTGIFAGSLVIQLGLGPYMVYQFHTLSLAAIFVNVPVILLTGWIVPLGLLAMVLPAGYVLPEHACQLLCALLLRLNALCLAGGKTCLVLASPHAGWIMLYYLCLAVFASEEGRLRRRQAGRRGRWRRELILVILAAFLAGTMIDDGFRQMPLVFVDVGQGDCMHLRVGSRNYLIDGGGSSQYAVGKQTLMPYLLSNGVRRVDAAFVTHLHTDHYRGICELAKEGMLRSLYVYEANRCREDQICAETGLDPAQIHYLYQGQRVHLGSRVREGNYLDVLWPVRQSQEVYQRLVDNDADENASSLIMRVNLHGVSVLATGDLGEEGEDSLLQGMQDGDSLSSDILKVGHHGSKTSSGEAFLDAVAPRLAVIQVGARNMYGHPTPEVLQRLQDRHISVCRNDLQGAIGVQVRRGRIKELRTMQ